MQGSFDKPVIVIFLVGSHGTVPHVLFVRWVVELVRTKKMVVVVEEERGWINHGGRE